MMDARDVCDVLAVLRDAGLVRVWLDGGWGVDALLGAQHRDHRDLDLVVPLEQLDEALAALAEVGFAVRVEKRPTRVSASDHHGREVDFHPVRFDEDGTGWQEGAAPGGDGDACYPAESFTHGWVAGERVGCIGPALQMAHHTGYEPAQHDRDDVTRLHEHFAIALPASYE